MISRHATLPDDIEGYLANLRESIEEKLRLAYDEGHLAGHTAGYKEGISEGYDAGYEQAKADANAAE